MSVTSLWLWHHVTLNGCISTNRGYSSFGWRSFSKCCQRQGIESTWHEREGWLCRLLYCLDVKVFDDAFTRLNFSTDHGHILTAMIYLWYTYIMYSYSYSIQICWVSYSLFIFYGSFLYLVAMPLNTLLHHAYYVSSFKMSREKSFEPRTVTSFLERVRRGQEVCSKDHGGKGVNSDNVSYFVAMGRILQWSRFKQKKDFWPFSLEFAKVTKHSSSLSDLLFLEMWNRNGMWHRRSSQKLMRTGTERSIVKSCLT